MKRLNMNITGIVQGVGFRPFVYRLAQRCHLGGFIRNNAAGVELEVEGHAAEVDAFAAALTAEIPPLAHVDAMTVREVPLRGEGIFVIKDSDGRTAKTALVSPDVATCADCLRELNDPADRRYRYPFINCTNCGPRYSIIRDVPYDRPATTMADFTMCGRCQEEYDNPSDRRFHAQPNACARCGPACRLLDSKGDELAGTGDIFTKVRQLIAGGAIVAIKGIGGYHLACDAHHDEAVRTLRRRKVREDKPFAVMCATLDTARALCQVSGREAALLSGKERPIVLLAKKDGCGLAPGIVPGNPYLGVMLPYTPLHYLLLGDDGVWVMTSGNISDEPIACEDADALVRLSSIADYFLVHNRPIYRRADDSVTRIVFDRPYMLRRSRGYVPAPLPFAPEAPPVLAVGGELKNAFCLTRGRQAFMSCHMGDLENMAAYHSYVDNIEHFKRLIGAEPQVIAYDPHPGYLATAYALEQNVPGIAVQHHHAHIAAVLAEHGLNERVIGIAFDGTGYGDDGQLWGGEFLLADLNSFTRAAHCRYLRLPGGEKAIREPWRQGAWMLRELYGQALSGLNIPFAATLPANWELALQAAEKGLNAPLSSGVGRLFDTAAAILGLRNVVNYEGQAAVELELACAGVAGKVLPYDISDGFPGILDFRPAFAAMTEGLVKGAEQSYLAACFHATLAAAVTATVRRLRSATGIGKVALSGGVWQNITLLRQVVGMLRNDGFAVFLHRNVPTNDGGLALGQAAVAASRFRA
jgi:hydrogenase maturation protein HypF